MQMNMDDFCRFATALCEHIQDEDVLNCWNLLLRHPQEMAFLDDWIDYLRDESGCSGFNFLIMDILYTEHRDKVVVSFLQEDHICDRNHLLHVLQKLRAYFSPDLNMRG